MIDGVVLSGGGTRSGYQAGALRALAEVHGVVAPKVLVLNSGGAGPGTFYLAGCYEEMYEWPELFDDPRLISLKRWRTGPLMDIDFLVDGILARQVPDLEARVRKSGTAYFIAATKFPRQPHWFSYQSGEPLLEQMRATATASGVSGPTVTINGVRYVDGCYSISLQDCVNKAFAEGATRVLVIDNASHGKTSPFTKALLLWGVRKADPAVKLAVDYFCKTPVEPVEISDNVVVCRRNNLASTHALTRKAARIRATIEQGYEDMVQLEI